MIGIIKMLMYVYVGMGMFYFLVNAKQNVPYILRHSPSLLAKIKSIAWLFGFSAIMGGFLLMKSAYKVGKQVVMMYKTYRTIKKLNKKK